MPLSYLHRDYRGRNRIRPLFGQPWHTFRIAAELGDLGSISVMYSRPCCSGFHSQVGLSETQKPHLTQSSVTVLKMAFHIINGIGNAYESERLLHLAGGH